MAAPRDEMDTRERTVFLAQQLHFANNLAGNEPKLRARAMRKLRKYLLARSSGNFSFTKDDFMRIWKGLFYCMWMSDKPLTQEELAEQISHLVHCFSSANDSDSVNDAGLMFIECFFSTVMVEWYGIDYHRLDKFQMFVRRFLRQSLVYCKNRKWNETTVTKYCNVLKSTVLSPKCDECSDMSLIMHIVDIFVEELAKVSEGNLPKSILLKFLEPFVALLAEQEDKRLQEEIKDKIFHCIIRQSPEGMEYEEKFEAWKRAGFPGRSWKDMVFVGSNDKRTGVKIKHLDPRAGKVNVYLPHLEFNAISVARLLLKYAKMSSKSQCRKLLKSLAKRFQDLSKAKYPLATNLTKLLDESKKYSFSKQKIDDAVETLLSFNKNLEKKARQIEGSGKRKKKNSSAQSKRQKKMKLEKENSTEEILEETLSEDDSEDGEYVDDFNSSEDLNGDADDLNLPTTSKQLNMIRKKRNANNKNVDICSEEGKMDRNRNEFELQKMSKNLKKKKKKKLQKSFSWDVCEIPNYKERRCVDVPEYNESIDDSEEKSLTTDACEDSEISKFNGVRDGDCEANTTTTDAEIDIRVSTTNELTQDGSETKSSSSDMNILIQPSESEVDISENISQSESDVISEGTAMHEESTTHVDVVVTFPSNQKISTPLRRSARRRSSMVQQSIEVVVDKEVSPSAAASLTPLRSSPRKMLSKVSLCNEVAHKNIEEETNVSAVSDAITENENTEQTSVSQNTEKMTEVTVSVEVVKDKQEEISAQTCDATSSGKEIQSPLALVAQRRLSVILHRCGKLDKEDNDNGVVLSDKKPMKRVPRRILASLSGRKSRASTVPDREIPSTPKSNEHLRILNNSSQDCDGESSDNSSITDSNCNGATNEDQELNPLTMSPRVLIRKTPLKKRASLRTGTPGSAKKVNIALQMNRSQAMSEYVAAVKQSPSVPHDANKKPCKGVLKRTSLQSPINPFYVPPVKLKFIRN